MTTFRLLLAFVLGFISGVFAMQAWVRSWGWESSKNTLSPPRVP